MTALTELPLGSLAGTLTGGFLLWSFTEYGLHNWYGHWPRGKTWFSREHLAHHADPHSSVAPAKKFLAGIIFTTPIAVISCLVLGALFGLALTASFLTAYLSYEYFHWRIHALPPRGRLMTRLYRHHLSHHFGSPKTNHGVTSELWDVVFRTWRKPTQMAVPLSQAPLWLFENLDSGPAIRPEFTADYRLVLPSSSTKQELVSSPLV